MTKQYLKSNSLFKIFNSTLVALPAPSSLTIFWNFGSLLSMCLMIQIVTGLLLASTYAPSLMDAFFLVSKMMELMDNAWWLRYTHANGASLFFMCLFLHIGRGIYFNSYLMKHTWNIGVTIFFLTMAAAFLGYVLPVNQMSFWGASVITNLATEIPYIGPSLIKFIWGSTSVEDPTINRFFMFHFILPFIILALVMLHITFLHTTGSSNPLGLMLKQDKIKFQYNFSMNDMMGVIFVLLIFTLLCVYTPLTLGDDENFTMANPAVTPHHIQPEWYFLFAYAILRSIPNKFGGVVALVMSIAILYTLPFTYLGSNKINTFYLVNKMLFWLMVTTVLLLTWIGARSVEDPYILTGQILTLMYFAYYVLNPIMMKSWDLLLQS